MSGCDEIREELSAYLDGELAPAVQEEVREHLAGCEACRSEHAGLVEVSLAAEALPRLEPPPFFTAQIMARVLEEPALTAPAAGRAPLAASASGRVRSGPGQTSARRGASGRMAAPAPEPAPVTPPGCVPDEELSALLDEALDTGSTAHARAHLSGCARCREVHQGLDRVRQQVQALPRLEAPPGFAAAVQERITSWEREEARREQVARVARARWWGWASWGAQAAGFLLLVGVGAALSTPETRQLAWGGQRYEKAGGRRGGWEPASADRQGAGCQRETATADDLPALPPGPYDATVELSTTSLAAAGEAALSMIQRQGGTLEGAPRQTPRAWSCVLDVPANRADDVLRGLAALPQLDAGREVEAIVSRVSTELDRVELRSGHVLVGQATPSRDGGVVVRLGSLAQEVAPRDLLRVERAADTRRLRIELRARE